MERKGNKERHKRGNDNENVGHGKREKEINKKRVRRERLTKRERRRD